MANIRDGVCYLHGKRKTERLTQSQIDILDVNTPATLITNITDGREYMVKGNGVKVIKYAIINEYRTGFDREREETLGVLEYCHDASSGIVYILSKARDSILTEVSGRTHFADGTTPLSDRTIAHIPDSETMYWYNGFIIPITEVKTCQLPDDNVEHYVGYEDDGELHVQTSVHDAIILHALITVITNNANTNENIWYGDERHGLVMSGQTHFQQHQTVHFQYAMGLDVEGILNNSTYFTKITAGRCGDEDVAMPYAEVTEIHSMWKEDGAWRVSATADNKLGHFVSGDCSYNDISVEGSEILAPIGASYIVMSIIATNNKRYPLVRFVAQNKWTSRTQARQQMPSNSIKLREDGLASNELKAICSYIIHKESTGQIEKGLDNETFVYCRNGFPVPMYDYEV